MATTHITISIEIMHDQKLNANQKFIFAEIQQLSSLEAGCYASNKHFSDLIGITRENVSRNLKALAGMGYISMEIKNGSRNHVRIITVTKTVTPPCRNSKPPLLKQQETKENIQSNIQKHTSTAPAAKVVHEVDKVSAETNKPLSANASDTQKIFEHWKKVHGKRETTKLSDKRRNKIKWALKYYSGKEICLAINGCKKSAWHMGGNPQGVTYNDLTNILKDDASVERFIDLATTDKQPKAEALALPDDDKHLQAWVKANGAPEADAGDSYQQWRGKLTTWMRGKR